MQNEPSDFVRKIFNRAVNIFIFAKSERDIEPASIDQLDPQDVLELEQAGLLVDNYWVSLEEDPGVVQSTVKELPLKDPKLVLDDWQQKSTISQARVNNLHDMNELIKGLTTSVLPTMAILFGLMVPGIRKKPGLFNLIAFVFVKHRSLPGDLLDASLSIISTWFFYHIHFFNGSPAHAVSWVVINGQTSTK